MNVSLGILCRLFVCYVKSCFRIFHSYGEVTRAGNHLLRIYHFCNTMLCNFEPYFKFLLQDKFDGFVPTHFFGWWFKVLKILKMSILLIMRNFSKDFKLGITGISKILQPAKIIDG